MKKDADEELEERIKNTTEVLRRGALDRGMVISTDDRVSEKDAEVICCYSTGGLRRAREMGSAPAVYRLPVNGSSYSYRLRDLAEYIERQRVEDYLL